MSGRSSPANGGYESARLTVRKDLFPSESDRLSPELDDEELVSYVKLETDFEQSIDEIAIQKQQLLANGDMSSPARSRHKKHKRRDAEREPNGRLPEGKRKKRSRHRTRSGRTHVPVISGKNLNLVSSSEYREVNDDSDSEDQQPEAEEAEEDPPQSSSDDEVLKYSVKLPLVKPRQSGKPYSHELSQLSTKKRKRDKERHSHVVTPCAGKPRSMMLHTSRSKRKSKKCESVVAPEPEPEPPAPPPAAAPAPATTYRSQIVDTHTMKIKIRKASVHETLQAVVSVPVAAPAPAPTLSVSDLGQRKSKKKRAASPVASESSGEEYDPTKGDTAAAMSVAAPRARHRPRNKRNHKADKSSHSKPNNSKSKDKSEKTERNRISAGGADSGPQSRWGSALPSELLLQVFQHVVASQGALPALVRLGRVCKLWHAVSCSPPLWRHVDLAQHTADKCKTDYKLVWLLEHRLSQCHSLNIAQWKVCNVGWVLACVAEYCPQLRELSVAGWSRITPDQLFELLQGLPRLQRLDLSHTSETGGSSTCLSAASMARVADTFGARLTHLTLANNKFTALPQILASVAAHCVNLEVLDISGALATSHPAAVPLEALQKGCPKLRVFRAANSQLVLQNATTQQQMECGGWPQLEELSIAGEAASEMVGEYKLGDEALARLVRGATRLRLLDLRGLQRLTDSGLVRVPAWELQHLFLGGCNVTRQSNACLELICEKWSHSLIELDLSWASASRPLDDAVAALADAPTSRLRTLNLCGSSVSLEPVKKVLLKCTNLESINLSSCRALPRGMKRLYTGKELQDLKDSLDPEKVKAKEEEKEKKAKTKKGKESKKAEADSKSDAKDSSSSALDTSDVKPETKDDASFLFQEPRSVASSAPSEKGTSTPETLIKASPDSKTADLTPGKDEGSTPTPEGRSSTRDATPALLSPPDSSCTPRAQPSPRYSPAARPDSQHASPAARPDSQHASPAARPDSQHASPAARPDSQHASPDVLPDQLRHNWSLGAYKSTPTHKSAEASPLSRLDGKLRHGKAIEQCSPTTSLETKRSPDAVKPDIKNPSWNYGNYSPMPRQEAQFAAQRSPYSAQPSPYSAQPSPYSAQPSPYSSQPSPYSAAASPDTSQVGKGAWGASPLRARAAHASPEPRRPPPGQHSPAEWGWPEPAWGAPGLRRAEQWPLAQYREEPPLDAFVEQSVSFESLRGAAPLLHAPLHAPHAYLDDAFSEGSRLD